MAIPRFILADFTSLRKDWIRIGQVSRSNVLFSSPDWSELWWQYFGSDSKLHLGSVELDGYCIGIAPLRIKNGIAYFIGNDDVCDFQDFVIVPGQEDIFYSTLFEHLAAENITSLQLSPLLPDSTICKYLGKTPTDFIPSTSCSQIDVIIGIDLPDNVSTYQSMLSSKQRHELLRKERRLNEEGDVKFVVQDKVEARDIDIFLRFFSESREDKNRFLTDTMESFFRSVIHMAASAKMLRMGILKLNDIAVAVTLGFEYRNGVYLYNSGYNPTYRWLSVGLMSKYQHVINCIESRKGRFDFLKGNEKYKLHLGGSVTPLLRCIIALSNSQIRSQP